MKRVNTHVAIVVLSILILSAGCKNQDTILNPSDGAKDEAQSSKVIPNEYIVEFKPEPGSENNMEAVTKRVNAILADYGIPQKSVLSVFESAFQGFAANFDASKAELLAKDPRVHSIIQNMEFTVPIEQPSVISPKSSPTIQTAGQIIPDGVRFVGGPGNGIGKRVWIMDTGVDLDNPDLCVDKTLSKDFTGTMPGGDDDRGHGTFIAGIIAAKDNDCGVVGVAAGATIVSVKVKRKKSYLVDYLEDMYSSSLIDYFDYLAVCNGIEYITKNANEGDVVNISWGNTEGPITGNDIRFESKLINLAYLKKVKIVIAAGQKADFSTGRNVADVSPPRISNGFNIYTVSALDLNSIVLSNENEKKLTSWSNYGVKCNFAAPGEGIESFSFPHKSGTCGSTIKSRGTSYAAPHVAGILLLGEISSNGEAHSPNDGKTIPIAHIAGANNAPTPQINSVIPITPLMIGDILTISGSSFGNQRSTNFVSFNGTAPQATDYISWNNTEIKVKVPTGSSTGAVNVRVDGKNSNEIRVVIKPEITSITPNATNVGDIVSITGSGFGNSQGINFVSFYNSIKLQARDYVSWSNTEIRIKLPSYVQSGKVFVSVTGNKSNDVNFTVTPPPPSIQWAYSYGGSSYDVATAIQPTSDGGYIVAGYTNSNNGDVTGNHGKEDCWVIKLNSSGIKQWQKTYGGSESDDFKSIQQTSDGGFICGGATRSFDGNVSGNHGSSDAWIVKLNSSGDIIWQKSLGGDHEEACTQIIQTSDGGYAVTGYSNSYNGDAWIPPRYGVGGLDFWIVKLNSSGVFEWQRRLGARTEDISYSLQQTNDGGFILAGSSNGFNGISVYQTFYDGDIYDHINSSFYDSWVVKINSTGSIEWSKLLGGNANDAANSIQKTSDGGFIISGYSESNNGDVSGNHGGGDSWIVKLNSGGGVEWQKSLGGTGSENAISIQQTNDGNYIIGGHSSSNNGDLTVNRGNNDYWIVKLGSTGKIIWQKSLGGSDDEEITSVKQSSDGGYVVAGYSKSTNGDVTGNHGNYDFWIVKLKSP